MCVSQDFVIKDKNEIISYVFTGIIKGKWNRDVEKLFSNHDIKIDYSQRGVIIIVKSH